MAVNYELHYLLGESYLDADRVMKVRKKAVLSEAATSALQTYAETPYWESTAYRTGYRGGFSNEPTFRMHTEAEECHWWECFSTEELEIIKDFCVKNGFDEAVREVLT